MTEPLSPAAQAVLKAANGRSSYGPDDCLNESRWIAAAALRAAADQVVPEDCLEHFPNDSAWQGGFTDANERIRFELLGIAAELEPQP
jgi:hypothetical protein